MTNGEKIKEIFPNIIKYGNILIDDTGALQKNILFDDTWWNAEYKEPTTQERQAESDKFDAAYQDGYNCGYAQARFDYEQDPTSKNDIAQERYQDLIDYFGDKEVAKTILEDRKEFKAWLERLRWNVKRADELARELKQLKETTKNDLEDDCIDRAQAQTEIEMNACRYTIAKECGGMGQVEWSDQLIKVSDAVDIIRHLPSVTPQEPTIKKI